MRIPVVVEPTSENRFRASSGDPLRLQAEASTREEAVQKLRELVHGRMKAGVQIVSLDLGAASHPLAPFAGMLKDDPLLEPWKQAVSEYRSERENDPETR